MDMNDTVRAAALGAAVQELTATLLRRYGPTLNSEALAGVLGLGPSGLRMRRQRGASLPDALDETSPMVWSTVTVALWLSGVSLAPSPAPPQASPKRKPGRPRFQPS